MALWKTTKKEKSKVKHEKKKYSPDEQAYRLIMQIVPELACYKEQTSNHLKNRAIELGLESLTEYSIYLKAHSEEINWLKVNLTLKGTHFFRGEDWEFFAEECLSKQKGRNSLKIWCAACSSGEEVYSLIMALIDYVPLEELDVLATDYNDELLEKCRKGQYFNMHYTEIPERYREYVETGPKTFRVRPELKAVVRTQNINLLTDAYPGPFDIILCRNVLKFFSPRTIPMIQKKLVASLEKNGYLFLSVDGDVKGVELIKRPELFGLKAFGERGIYQRV